MLKQIGSSILLVLISVKFSVGGIFGPGLSVRPFPVALQLESRDNERMQTLCTYSEISYNKCLHTIHVAANQSIDLPLNCVQKPNRESCIRDVQQRGSDMVVLQDYDYLTAREHGLKPIVFARETPRNYYVAIAPRNISLIDFNEAPLAVDVSVDRAFRAAVAFNTLRGHTVCPQFETPNEGIQIKIVNSMNYMQHDDEILICVFGGYNAAGDFASCNWEIGLQDAVFVPHNVTNSRIGIVRRIFDTIYKEFGQNSEINGFNFFENYDGSSDILFKDNTESFDSQPTYINAVNEKIFNSLQCKSPENGRVENVQTIFNRLARGFLGFFG